MSGSGDEDTGNPHDERWVQKLEKAPVRERLWWRLVDFELTLLNEFGRRRGLKPSEASYPELACLRRVGHSAELVAAVRRRALREACADLGAPLALVGVGSLIYVIAGALTLLGDVGFASGAFLALVYTALVIGLGMWGVGRSSEAEPRLFGLVVGAVDELNTLRRLKVLQFTPSDRGKQKIIKARASLRKSLRKQAREAVLLAASLTGTRTSDEGYFKCARTGLWLLHASENIDDVEAIDGALFACGYLLDHLLHKKTWEVAELPSAPGDAADLSTSRIGKVVQYVGARIQLGLITALIGLAAAVFGLVARVS